MSRPVSHFFFFFIFLSPVPTLFQLNTLRSTKGIFMLIYEHPPRRKASILVLFFPPLPAVAMSHHLFRYPNHSIHLPPSPSKPIYTLPLHSFTLYTTSIIDLSTPRILQMSTPSSLHSVSSSFIPTPEIPLFQFLTPATATKQFLYYSILAVHSHKIKARVVHLP